MQVWCMCYFISFSTIHYERNGNQWHWFFIIPWLNPLWRRSSWATDIQNEWPFCVTRNLDLCYQYQVVVKCVIYRWIQTNIHERVRTYTSTTHCTMLSKMTYIMADDKHTFQPGYWNDSKEWHVMLSPNKKVRNVPSASRVTECCGLHSG
jgi:hypothetical protein